MRLGLHNPAISLMRMEQLVEDRDHLKRRKEEDFSDGSLNRDGVCDSKPQPDSGIDRQLTPMESTIFRSRKLSSPELYGQWRTYPFIPPPPYPIHSPLPGNPILTLGNQHWSTGIMPHHRPKSYMPPPAAPQSTVVTTLRASILPRGGPPRSWTNDDLTKALENVWSKRMTTSQANRVFWNTL